MTSATKDLVPVVLQLTGGNDYLDTVSGRGRANGNRVRATGPSPVNKYLPGALDTIGGFGSLKGSQAN